MKKELNPRLKRVLAIITLILMAGCAIGLIVSVIQKAGPRIILAFLFGLMVVPCVFYIIIRFGEISRKQ